MEPTSTASIKTARWFLAVLFVVSLYRAMTQPVTPGEAWNYHRFVGISWTESFANFDINNHVLNTLLVRISTKRFHLTELSLRLPSLLAGVLYLWAVYRLARRWFGTGSLFLTVVGLLTLNPLIVDALSEARGYGMAMACWMWALELILESIQSVRAKKLKGAAVCLGLSVAASLAFIVPAIALLSVYLMWSSSRAQRAPSGSARVSPPGRTLVIIFCLTLFLLLAIPLNHAEWKSLAVGATSLRKTINELTELSLGTSLKLLDAIARIALAIVALAGVVAAVRFWRRHDAALTALTGASLTLTLVILIAAHRWLHTPFPQESSIYLIPLTVLPVTAWILKAHNKAAEVTLLSLSTILLICYLSVFPFGSYRGVGQFSGARTLAKTLRAQAGNRQVTIGASLAAEPIINYYRVRYRQGNWQPILRRPLTGAYNYYVLTPVDAELIEKRHLHVLYRDAGLTLAQ